MLEKETSNFSEISSTTDPYQEIDSSNRVLNMNLSEPVSINNVDSTQDQISSTENNLSKTDLINTEESNQVSDVNFVNEKKISYSRDELIEFSKLSYCNICPNYLKENSLFPQRSNKSLEPIINKKPIIKFDNPNPNLRIFKTREEEIINCMSRMNEDFVDPEYYSSIENSDPEKFKEENRKANFDFCKRYVRGMKKYNNPNLKINNDNRFNDRNQYSKFEDKKDGRNFLRSRGENLNQNFASFRQSSYRNTDYMNHKTEEEPEWFKEGPINQHDTVELKGFDDDENLNTNKNHHIINTNNNQNDLPQFKNDLHEKNQMNNMVFDLLDENGYDNTPKENVYSSRSAKWFNNPAKKIEKPKDKTITCNNVKNLLASGISHQINQVPVNQMNTQAYNNSGNNFLGSKTDQQLANILQKARININNLMVQKDINKNSIMKGQIKSVEELEASFLNNSNVKKESDALKSMEFLQKLQLNDKNVRQNKDNENKLNPVVMNLLDDAQKQMNLNYLQNIIHNNNNIENNKLNQVHNNKLNRFMPTSVIRKIAKDKNSFVKGVGEANFETVTGNHVSERSILNKNNVQDNYSQKNMFQQEQKFDFSNFALANKNLQHNFLQNNMHISVNRQQQWPLNTPNQTFNNVDNHLNQFKNEEKANIDPKSLVLSKILIKATKNNPQSSNFILSCLENSAQNGEVKNQNTQNDNQKKLIEILQKASNNYNKNDVGNKINHWFQHELKKNNDPNFSPIVKENVFTLEEIEKKLKI